MMLLAATAESSPESSVALALSVASLATTESLAVLGWAGDSFEVSGVASEMLSMEGASAVLASSPDASDASGVAVSSTAAGSASSASAEAVGAIPVANTNAIAHLKERIPKWSILIAAPHRVIFDSIIPYGVRNLLRNIPQSGR